MPTPRCLLSRALSGDSAGEIDIRESPSYHMQEVVDAVVHAVLVVAEVMSPAASSPSFHGTIAAFEKTSSPIIGLQHAHAKMYKS